MAAGFAVATMRSAVIAHPILQTRDPQLFSGWVEVREGARAQRPHSSCVRTASTARGLRKRAERVRVAVRRGTAPPVGAFVEMPGAALTAAHALRIPATTISRAIGFFARSAPLGYAFRAHRIVEPPVAPPTWHLRYAAAIDAMRDAIDKRIRSVVPGERGLD